MLLVGKVPPERKKNNNNNNNIAAKMLSLNKKIPRKIVSFVTWWIFPYTLSPPPLSKPPQTSARRDQKPKASAAATLLIWDPNTFREWQARPNTRSLWNNHPKKIIAPILLGFPLYFLRVLAILSGVIVQS